MVLDIKRAFLHAPMQREVYIELPEEAKSPGDGDVVGRLLKSMYATRDAPLGWQDDIAEYLMSIGFVRAKALGWPRWLRLPINQRVRNGTYAGKATTSRGHNGTHC